MDIVIDSPEEIKIIAQYHPFANIIIRTLSDESSSKIKFNTKFGANEEQIHKILELSKKYQLNIHGFSFHV